MTAGVVAAVESLAADVGGEVLRAGGNAADAAIATAFAQGVVDPIYCGIGGTFVGLFYDAAAGRAQIVSGGGRAPRQARAGMWRITGQWGAMWTVEGDRNRLGYEASTVPGFVRGAAEAFHRFGSGRISWERLIAPSIALAEEGFAVYPYLYRLWMPSTDRMRGFIETGDGPRILSTTDECRRIYLHDDGSVYEIGERLVQTDYARTLKRIAKNGPDEFYEGETARLMVDDFQRNGGLLDAEDLRSCRAEVGDPAMTTFREYQVFTDRPPAVGLVTLEVLNVLEGLDLAAFGLEQSGVPRSARARDALGIPRPNDATWRPGFRRCPVRDAPLEGLRGRTAAADPGRGGSVLNGTRPGTCAAKRDDACHSG